MKNFDFGMEMTIDEILGGFCSRSKNKQWQEIVNDANKLLETTQPYLHPLVYDYLSYVCRDAGQYERAIEYCNKAISTGYGKVAHYLGGWDKGDIVSPYVSLGIIYRILKQYEKSIEYLTQALKINEKSTGAYNALGIVYDDLKEFNKAIDNYSKVIELAPNYTAAYTNRGIAFYYTHRFHQAQVNWLKAYSVAKQETQTIKDEEAKQYAYEYYAGTPLLYLFHIKNELHSPFLLRFVIKKLAEFLNIKQNVFYENIWQANEKLCTMIEIYCQHLHLNHHENPDYYGTLGLIYYFMGGYFDAYNYFEKAIEKQRNNLCWYYYLIQTGAEFLENTEHYQKIALQKAEDIANDTKKYKTQDCYYAGLILENADKDTEAQTCFQSIHLEYIPALYRYYAENTKDKDLLKLLQFKEKSRIGHYQQFIKKTLDISSSDILTPFLEYAQYNENRAWVLFFYNACSYPDQRNLGFPARIAAIPYFYEIWEIAAKDTERIKIQNRQNILRLLEDALEQEEVKSARLTNLEKSQKPLLVEALRSEADLEKKLADYTENKKATSAQIKIAMLYFWVNGKINTTQCFRLLLYWAYRFSIKNMNEATKEGIKKAVEEGGEGLLSLLPFAEQIKAIPKVFLAVAAVFGLDYYNKEEQQPLFTYALFSVVLEKVQKQEKNEEINEADRQKMLHWMEVVIIMLQSEASKFTPENK